MLVAEGVVDIACEPKLELYDMATPVPIVTKVGGRLASLRAEEEPWDGNTPATSGLLRECPLRILGWPGFATSDEE